MATESRNITMTDGRVVAFGMKQRMAKDYGAKDGQVYATIDFDNGETVRVELAPTTEIGMLAMGHGMIQKLGDAAAGADTTDDAFEAVLEIASRLSNGQWTKPSTAGNSVAKGSSELIEAFALVTGQSKEVARAKLSNLAQADKMALRKTARMAEAIETIRAGKGVSKAANEKLSAAEALLEELVMGDDGPSQGEALV